MSGIIHLKDLYDKNGYAFIEQLFTNGVCITEKIDGARFASERNIDKPLDFYKRDSKTPITMIDRIVMKYYEPAIKYIESIQDELPYALRFGFEYFANTQPGSIVYDKIPTNSLILTDISHYNGAITDINVLQLYAKKFNVSPPPVIFNGFLSKEQKDKLVDFLTTDWEDLYLKFGTESFTSYIISILNPKLKNTALHIGTTKPIEGIVFSFNHGTDITNAKVVDPLYTQKARKMARERFTPEKKEHDSKIKFILRDILSFMRTDADYNIILQSDGTDLRFIELLNNIFIQYYRGNKGKFKGISTDSKSDDIPMLDINYSLIKDLELKTILRKDTRVKCVYKAFLSAFGKKRKRGTVVIDKSMLTSINLLISKLRTLTECYDVYTEHTERIINEIIDKTTT